ncbi:ISL3 family transposase [Streptomyces sp. KLMMK]|uniref:ISL3 family transposase n=1 Tax=Streptomyces sp. KLMMK TaxID=3109353 RepID=UPI00300963CB
MTIKTSEDVLFPGISVQVGSVEETSGELVVEAVAIGRPGRCPDCRSSARRVHSSYHRRLAERPLGPRRIVVRLKVRRFFCDRKSCQRRTSAEQVAGFTERHRRISVGLKERLQAVAVELGGRPGARLCRKVQMKAGRTLLLGLLQAPPVPTRAPRVLGVDDFALRRRTRYATVLVDVEASRVVDVLPGRTTEALADWLTQHPGAEVICRDRASAYSKAIRQAAPHALEVADRWQCAMRRLVVSPAQPGGIRREVPGSDGSPDPETVKGNTACQKSDGRAQVSETVRRGTRVIRRKLDCLNSNPQKIEGRIHRKDT